MGRNQALALEAAANTAVALLAEGVGRNHHKVKRFGGGLVSPSSRRAWVEISNGLTATLQEDFALLAEGVGRNRLAGGGAADHAAVALLAEGVGRNCFQRYFQPRLQKSPSSRRAWVEMPTPASRSCRASTVALLAEGVGRNRLPAHLVPWYGGGRPPRGGRG